MYLESVLKLVGQLQQQKPGGNSEEKGAKKHKNRNFSKSSKKNKSGVQGCGWGHRCELNSRSWYVHSHANVDKKSIRAELFMAKT